MKCHILNTCVSCEYVLVSPISDQARDPKRVEEKFSSSTEESKVSMFISNGSIDMATHYMNSLDTVSSAPQYL